MRGKKFKRWWQQYAGSVAFLLLIVIGVIGFTRAEILANNIRDASVESCTEANGQRAALRASFIQDARRTARLDVPALFPNADQQVLRDAARASIRFKLRSARLFRPVNCHERFPERARVLPFMTLVFDDFHNKREDDE